MINWRIKDIYRDILRNKITYKVKYIVDNIVYFQYCVKGIDVWEDIFFQLTPVKDKTKND